VTQGLMPLPTGSFRAHLGPVLPVTRRTDHARSQDSVYRSFSSLGIFVFRLPRLSDPTAPKPQGILRMSTQLVTQLASHPSLATLLS